MGVDRGAVVTELVREDGLNLITLAGLIDDEHGSTADVFGNRKERTIT